MPERGWSPEELAAELRPLLLGEGNFWGVWQPADCKVLDVRPGDDDVLVTFRFMCYPHDLGYRLALVSEYAEDGVVHPPDHWASDAYTWLQEQLGTGLVSRGARQQRDGVIELSEPGYPYDERFATDSIELTSLDGWVALDSFRSEGLDSSAVEDLRAAGTLISWERAYLDNRAGWPYVGHAAAVRTGDGTAHLAFCHVVAGVPDTVMLQLCHGAAQEASWQGARRVTTDLAHPALDLLGFRHRDGRRELATDFLHVDHAAVARLLSASQRWRPLRRSLRARLQRRFAGI